MWYGSSFPMVNIERCDYAEDILKSSKHIEKSSSYKFFEDFLGQGSECCSMQFVMIKYSSFVSGLISSKGRMS